MIYTVIEENNTLTAYTFEKFEQFNSFVFNPNRTPVFITSFKIKGKTYEERKNYAENLAIEYSNTIAAGLSYSEYSQIENRFYKIGKRYGLLNEFKENAIC